MLQTNVAPGVHRIEDAHTNTHAHFDHLGFAERARSHYLATQPRALPYVKEPLT